MKKQIIILLALAVSAPLMAGENNTASVNTPERVKMVRNGDLMSIDMVLRLGNLDIKGNEALIITPRLSNGNDAVTMQSIGIYGRRRYIYYMRNHEYPLTGEAEQAFRVKARPDTLQYSLSIPYREWMNGATLTLDNNIYGCCKALLDRNSDNVGYYEEFCPVYTYIQPEAVAEKVRLISGSAFIDFPVNRTEIYPDYRNNTAELGKISATIDSVRNDSDVTTIREVWLKGFASPESSYAHNTYLARERVAAVKEYIQNLYHFPDGVLSTEYEPENWAGLRRFVDNSNLAHRNEILALIDSDIAPDAKEKQIKTAYADEYRFILTNWYPALRHTDYRIEYTVRSFYDSKEIERIMHTAPHKLSLNEFYVLSNTCTPGSDLFNEIFETAVRMYPGDCTANLNAAINALQRGDTKRASGYLKKAGDSPQAEYARGLLMVEEGDFNAAAKHLTSAADAGVKEAGEALTKLTKLGKL